MLIAEGRDVHTVKTMMGHRNVSTTIDVYGGDFDKARNADPNAPRPNYGNVLETAPADSGLRLVAETRAGSQTAAC
jgi:hypothetical protein